jgi:hypothetical protein
LLTCAGVKRQSHASLAGLQDAGKAFLGHDKALRLTDELRAHLRPVRRAACYLAINRQIETGLKAVAFAAQMRRHHLADALLPQINAPGDQGMLQMRHRHLVFT